MWPYALATLYTAWRSPVSWCALAVGVFTAWFGVTASVLALDDAGPDSIPLVLSSAHLVGVLLAAWLLGRGLDDDAHSGFALSADATGPGAHGRLLGRWAGASIAGVLLAAACGLTTGLVSQGPAPGALLLLYTSSLAIAHAGAWGLLLHPVLRGGGVTVGVALLWVLGHLPWGTAPFLDGPPGRLVAGVLPGPQVAGHLQSLGYTSAAVAGLLLVALAFSRPMDG